MEETKLGVIESRLADLIWAHAPLPSRELVKLCQEELTRKKSTTVHKARDYFRCAKEWKRNLP